MTVADMPHLAKLIAAALHSDQPETQAGEVAEWRASFDQLQFIHER